PVLTRHVGRPSSPPPGHILCCGGTRLRWFCVHEECNPRSAVTGPPASPRPAPHAASSHSFAEVADSRCTASSPVAVWRENRCVQPLGYFWSRSSGGGSSPAMPQRR